jgi:hypothetical protein
LDAVDGDAFNERRAGDVNLGLEGAGINESDRAEGRYQLELNGDGKSERLGKEGREGGRVREGSKRDDDAVVKDMASATAHHMIASKKGGGDSMRGRGRSPKAVLLRGRERETYRVEVDD